MRVLHFLKTANGAQWAVDQVNELVTHGIEVHVALPKLEGELVDGWKNTGATIHQMDVALPLKAPHNLFSMTGDVRQFVEEIQPDIIHSHFFSTTLGLRYALGRNHPIPRVFQVPGPLHMEHAFFRRWELSSAGVNDVWIASSRYTLGQYLRAGIPNGRLYLSYYGNQHHPLPAEGGVLRTRFGIRDREIVVGNVNYMYPPKLYLGQTRGIKRHEDVIEAMGEVIQQRDDAVGLIVGGQWGGGAGYENKLRKLAARLGRNRIFMAGHLPSLQAKSAWLEFDVAVHTPISENCGGVIEPLLAGVPVIAARTGGLPEIIYEDVTGKLVDARDPVKLATAINTVISDLPRYRAMAEKGRHLVTEMFDVKRTAAEIAKIYRHVLDPSLPLPEPFRSDDFLANP